MAMPGIQNALAGTKPWVRLVSILGFISAGFMIVAGLFAAVLGGFSDAMPAGATAIFLIYPLMGALYAVPSLYLFRYASRIDEYVRGGQEIQLELALDTQRAFWKFVGILCVISIVIAIVGIIASIAIPAFLLTR